MLPRPETRSLLFDIGEQKIADLPPEKLMKESPDALDSAYAAFHRCQFEIESALKELNDPHEIAANGLARLGALKRRKAYIFTLVGDLAGVAAPWMIKDLHDSLPFR